MPLPAPPAPRSYARALVSAADAAGAGACVSICLVDQNSATIVSSEEVHTTRELVAGSNDSGIGGVGGVIVFPAVLTVAMFLRLARLVLAGAAAVEATAEPAAVALEERQPLAARPPASCPPTAHQHECLPADDPV